jgi:DNA-binding NarL/FixJ family response regulator
MIDVLIIDKTEQIKSLLLVEKARVQAFDDEVKALNAVEQMSSAVVLLHYNVREEQTEEYIELIMQASSKSKVVVIADELDEKAILTCLLAGAKGYQKINQLSDYAEKLVTVMDAGEAWITRRMTATLLDSLRRQ